MKLTIKETWEEYQREVLVGIHPETIQYREMQKAFFAGATRMLQVLLTELSELDEEEGAKALDSLLNEGVTFFNDLAKEWD